MKIERGCEIIILYQLWYRCECHLYGMCGAVSPTVLIARPDSPKFALWNREPKALEGAHGLKGASLSSPRI